MLFYETVMLFYETQCSAIPDMFAMILLIVLDPFFVDILLAHMASKSSQIPGFNIAVI